MSETENIQAIPMQRNDRDVALELTQLYYSNLNNKKDMTIKDIRDTYSKMYATVIQCVYKTNSAKANDYINKINESFNAEK